jgi:hypothetical protein
MSISGFKAVSRAFVFSLAVMLVGTAAAGAAPGNGNGPKKDSVTGGGKSAVDTQFGFAAHSGPNGENPHGHATLKNKGAVTERKGHVVCLRVEGNRAIFGIRLQKPDPSNPNPFREFVVQDNGNPSSGTPDLLQEASDSATPPDCDSVPPLLGLPIKSGNINVTDG